MIAAVAFVATMSLALVSCGGGNKNADPPVSDSPAQVEDEAEARPVTVAVETGADFQEMGD